MVSVFGGLLLRNLDGDAMGRYLKHDVSNFLQFALPNVYLHVFKHVFNIIDIRYCVYVTQNICAFPPGPQPSDSRHRCKFYLHCNFRIWDFFRPSPCQTFSIQYFPPRPEQSRMFSYRILTPILGGLLMAASIRFFVTWLSKKLGWDGWTPKSHP